MKKIYVFTYVLFASNANRFLQISSQQFCYQTHLYFHWTNESSQNCFRTKMKPVSSILPNKEKTSSKCSHAKISPCSSTGDHVYTQCGHALEASLCIMPMRISFHSVSIQWSPRLVELVRIPTSYFVIFCYCSGSVLRYA